MNAWTRETIRTALALGEILQAEPSPIDLDVALIARAAVLDGVALVMGDIVPRTRHGLVGNGRLVPLGLVEQDPVRALGLVLRGREQPAFTRSPSELLDAATPVGTPTDFWAAAGRHALLAARAWQGVSAATLSPDAAWKAVGEAAALAEAIAMLDTSLLRVGAHRPDLSRTIGATAGLRLAARETQTLAELGGAARTRTAEPTSPAPQQVNLRPASGVGTLPQGKGRDGPDLSRQMGRLTAVLHNDATELTPSHVRICARVGRDLAILSARSAVAPDGHDLRVELGDLARALHTAAEADRGEVALVVAPSRAVELQLRDLHIATMAALSRRVAPDGPEATRIAGRLPDLVGVLAEKTGTEVDARRWAAPDRREGAELAYALASRTEPERRPAVVGLLGKAVTAGDALRARVTAEGSPHPGGRRTPGAVVVLRDHRRDDLFDLRRPAHPASATRPLPRDLDAPSF